MTILSKAVRGSVTVPFASALLCTAAYADDGDITYASDHAPIGVMADHRHNKGELMFSYRFMYMDMDGSRDGTTSLTPEEIVTTVPNRFANPPMMPPTLRVVPTDMQMRMHMVGAMYGLTDRITLMAMGMFTTKEMDHLTFQGPMGTNILGEFRTESSGFGDTTVGAIVGLDDGSKDHEQFNVGVAFSLPTGSITETDQILTPTGATPTPRLPYPMQLGSGTVDFKPSITGRTRFGNVSIGAQASAAIRLGTNDEGYSLGDRYELTAWTAYEFAPWISLSARLRGETMGSIEGIDPLIMAPVQTADPDNQGGDQIEALFGVNLAGQKGIIAGHRLAVEVGVPLVRDLNGPQLETDFTLTLGWQKSF
ncbi:MAG: transporter [Pseudomonadota bacterium]